MKAAKIVGCEDARLLRAAWAVEAVGPLAMRWPDLRAAWLAEGVQPKRVVDRLNRLVGFGLLDASQPGHGIGGWSAQRFTRQWTVRLTALGRVVAQMTFECACCELRKAAA